MRILKNTLFVTNPGAYLSLDGENIVVQRESSEVGRIPLHNLESIVTCGYTGASPALMAACCKRQIALSFLSPSGHFLGRVSGAQQGNVLLRRIQYRIADDPAGRSELSRPMIAAKLYNARWVLERAIRDHALRVDTHALRTVCGQLRDGIQQVQDCTDDGTLRGIEGKMAAAYFGVFDQLILQNRDGFSFVGRNRRPPLDPVNCLLSFVYTLLAHDTAAALETVGLDPYVGFLHTDRPGRMSLALDLMEELRAVVADRFVLTLINKRQVTPNGFVIRENGAVRMEDETKRTVLKAWQERKQEIIAHPFLGEKLEWGLVPYAQALLLARYLRGDLDGYPPFLWK